MDLLSQMLKADPLQRITAKGALEHPYFQVTEENDKPLPSPCLTAASCKVKKVWND